MTKITPEKLDSVTSLQSREQDNRQNPCPSPVTYSPQAQKPFKLRDYQKTCVAQVLQAWRRGCRAPLLYSPTGSGKTAMASHIMNAATRKGHKVLFVVHRDPLVEQTAESLQLYGIEAGYIKAGYLETDGSHPVVIASIQTLARRQLPDDIGLVIADECHTTAWYDTYQSRVGQVYYYTLPPSEPSVQLSLHSAQASH